jgi:hypothetical protein
MTVFATAFDFSVCALFFFRMTRSARRRWLQRAVVRRMTGRTNLMARRCAGLFFGVTSCACGSRARLVGRCAVTGYAARMSGVVRRARKLGSMTIPANLWLFRRLEVMRRVTLRTSNAFSVGLIVGVRNFRVAGRTRNGFLVDILSMRLMTADAVSSCAVRNLNAGVTRHT